MKLVTLFTLVALSSSLFMTCQALSCNDCNHLAGPARTACANKCATCANAQSYGYLPKPGVRTMFTCSDLCKTNTTCETDCNSARQKCCFPPFGCCAVTDVKTLCK
ncbi:hypothetical protein CF319_g7984 [Tilletia indica]|uniref:Uncharacterized protein n=1 Tax=Tilletia indica TaxID=43049 RepID=A0A177T757_9BASI|nr:hypothetical protein CF319_g7984 [Tilletia indica]KAE8237618.1 hypothetical protein A4X13_0g8706 [Tilletia indica]